ncbi:ribonuclease toxin immunity protein CdiI [Marinobacter lacisalsi]|uniref:Ribonuclease toxin immunity protein CdiI n=1 Tax=Marinobacter lacisalsi TaxID=475979 RepID=A0ABV8QGA2_9GAMM
MSDNFRVVLDDKFLPVQVFFNAIPDRRFIDTLMAFESGSGAGFNDACCSFPGEEEFDEEPLTGVEFAIKDEKVVIGSQDFLWVLEKACKAYLDDYPSMADQIAELLPKIRAKVSSLI